MTGVAAELSGTMVTGRYRLVRALGGGDGHVHEARHDRLPDRFALKLFGDAEPRAFARCAQQASALRHEAIVQVLDYGAAPGRAFVVMEWVEGRSLAAILAEEGPLAPDAVARIIDSIALGLQAAHRQGLAHGHLAPERILVLTSGVHDATGHASTTLGVALSVARTKILGFGFGPGDALTPVLSITEVTPYTAPEQLANDASPLGDQFALGAIAYELLTGEPPVVDAHLRRAPRSIREYDPTINVIVDDVVQRAVSLDPGARWADVYTFAKRLRETIDADGLLEEKTRLAPLPLTVTRPASPPLAAERRTDRRGLAQTPTPINLPPVIASSDVDLRTPAPRRLELPTLKPVFKMPLQGEISMNPPPSRPPAPRGPGRMPGQVPTPRFASASKPPQYTDSPHGDGQLLRRARAGTALHAARGRRTREASGSSSSCSQRASVATSLSRPPASGTRSSRWWAVEKRWPARCARSCPAPLPRRRRRRSRPAPARARRRRHRARRRSRPPPSPTPATTAYDERRRGGARVAPGGRANPA